MDRPHPDGSGGRGARVGHARPGAAIAGWALAAVAVVVTAVAVVLEATGTTFPWILIALTGVIPLTFSLIGALIVALRPANRLGWLFAVAGLVTAVTLATQAYGEGALADDPGSSAGRAAAWITDLTNVPSFGLVTVFLFLLFPDGRLGSRAARRVAVVAIAGIGVWIVGVVLEPTLQGHGDIPTPLAPAIPSWIPWAFLIGGVSTVFVAMIGSVVLLVGRLRRAVGRERDQLRLLAWAAALATVLFTPALLAPPNISDPARNVVYLLGGTGFLLIPAAVGVAILRHRLLDIDLVIRRTVVIAVLGAFITAVYIGVVVGVGAVVGASGNAVLSAVAAAVVALAFQPVRRWARRVANRFVYGERATPYEVLHEFAERVAGSYGTEDVLPRMAAILGEGTGADRAQVWLRIGDELRPAAAWPRGVQRSPSVRAAGEDLPPLDDVSLSVAVRDEGDLLGALSITKRAADPVNTTQEQLVDDLALQAGLVLRNVRLLEDLRASRQRLVAAQDQERRRIERDIHDGAQQQLVALQVKQRLAEQIAERDPGRAKELLGELQAETAQALQDLRDLARGIYPPLLADEGLAAALESQARKASMPVQVRADGARRYPQEVEAAVYFCCLEALQNAAKYAGDAGVRIALATTEDGLRFEVADDGAGFDPASTPRGSGLQNMVDRLEAVGGRLEIIASPGAGTTLIGEIPSVG